MKYSDITIIGAGFFGLKLALIIAKQKPHQNILIVDQEKNPCTRASYINQARVHNGYHYPRNYATALSSHRHYDKFISEYSDCVQGNFIKLYAVASNHSYINSLQFERFCARIGIPLSPPPLKLLKLFQKELIENVYIAEESAFNIENLRKRMLKEIEDKTNIQILFGFKVENIEKTGNGFLIVDSQGEKVFTENLFNVTYAGINSVLKRAGLDPIDLKLEIAEICLVEPPEELRNIGISIMDGQFFSFMPFPPFQCHSFTHVRYTPHVYWHERDTCFDPYRYLQTHPQKSNFIFMKNDAKRYVPIMDKVRYLDSRYEIKCVVTRNESNDGRPIVIKVHHKEPLFISILGSKIDNIYDLESEINLIYS